MQNRLLFGLSFVTDKPERQMTVFPAQTPARGDLRTLLATRTMQSVRCAVFWPRDTSDYRFINQNHN